MVKNYVLIIEIDLNCVILVSLERWGRDVKIVF